MQISKKPVSSRLCHCTIQMDQKVPCNCAKDSANARRRIGSHERSSSRQPSLARHLLEENPHLNSNPRCPEKNQKRKSNRPRRSPHATQSRCYVSLIPSLFLQSFRLVSVGVGWRRVSRLSRASFLSAMETYVHRLRASANGFLSQYEPLALVFSPLVAVSIAFVVRSVLLAVQDNGIKACVTALLFNSVKLIPGIKRHIEAEKEKVVEKLQSGGKAKREGWQTELPKLGLGRGVLEMLENEKAKDVAWEGRCSGTVYVSQF
ncbi:hypothetical protein ACLOJK_008361 [Asimina triloba]